MTGSTVHGTSAVLFDKSKESESEHPMTPDMKKIAEENTNRPSCLDCARKHVGKARVKIIESKLGYPRHAWYACAEMGEAEDELVKTHPELAEAVREQRLVLQDSLDDATTASLGGELIIDPDRIEIPDFDTLMDVLTRAALR